MFGGHKNETYLLHISTGDDARRLLRPKPAEPPGEYGLKRELTSAEKLALTPFVAAGLKDPSAAQLKWMPVVLTERDGITDYCALVNGKNSYGGYAGFVRFYAQLSKDDKGQFIKAKLREVEPPNRERNPIDPRWLTVSASNLDMKISAWLSNSAASDNSADNFVHSKLGPASLNQRSQISRPIQMTPILWDICVRPVENRRSSEELAGAQ